MTQPVRQSSNQDRRSGASIWCAAVIGAGALLIGQPTPAAASTVAHVSLHQALTSLPTTVPALKWTLFFRGAFHQSITLAACDDGAKIKVGPYVHAEYDGPVTAGNQSAGFVIVVVFATAAKASHALATLTAQARHCPSRYAPPFGDGVINTTVTRRTWAPSGWRGFEITSTSTQGAANQVTQGVADVFAARGNVLVESLTGDDLRAATLARQSLWARQLATAITSGLNSDLR